MFQRRVLIPFTDPQCQSRNLTRPLILLLLDAQNSELD